MILIDAGQRNELTFDARLMFADQLARRGHRVGLDESTLPAELSRSQKYQGAALIVAPADAVVTRVVILGAEDIGPETLATLRSYHLPAHVDVVAAGRFADRQSVIAAHARLAYVLGREPQVVDLLDLQRKPLLADATSPLAAGAIAGAPAPRRVAQLLLILPPELLEQPANLAALHGLSHRPDLALHVVPIGKTKAHIPELSHTGLSVIEHAELGPEAFAAMADIAVFLGEGLADERLAMLAMVLMGTGRVAVDCTRTLALVTPGAPALRGPEELAALGGYLAGTVLPNLTAIRRFAGESAWLQSQSLDRIEAALGLAPPAAVPAQEHPPRTLFLPTNGIGLGHAQRCCLVAAAMAGDSRPAFAAFPSCVPLVQARGFDCLPLVQKSPHHPEPHANDLVTYLRLGRALGHGDRLVFDGGFVFDSVYRLVIEKQLDAVWIRRGLWQPGQVNNLDRERIFRTVIVPAEAFDELNQQPWYGSPARLVGPIVQEADGLPAPDDVRKRLRARFGHPCGELVVTMLGAGHAADRSAQLQALCNLFERREGCLHLIVTWPGSIVAPGLYRWRNSRVVRTVNAMALCRAADMAIAAAGYNSFHELLYHGVPTVFVPQMSEFMDDQQRRARAAAERQVAAAVQAQELLLLEREVAAFLDGGKAAAVRASLAQLALPARGNAAAAALIEGGGAR